MAKKPAKQRSTKTLGEIFGASKKGATPAISPFTHSSKKMDAAIKQRMATIILSITGKGKK